MIPSMNASNVPKTEIPVFKPQGTNEQLSGNISSTNVFKAFNITSNSMASKTMAVKPSTVSSNVAVPKLRIKGLTDE